jgi:hypothetical protein
MTYILLLCLQLDTLTGEQPLGWQTFNPKYIFKWNQGIVPHFTLIRGCIFCMKKDVVLG